MISTPLLALTMPPLQAAAILLPILLCQDVISVWVYRRDWSAWNLKVLLPGSVVGVGAAWLFAAYVPNAYVEIAVGVIGVCFALYTLLRARAGASRSGRARRPGCSGARSRASPRPSSRSARRPTRCTSCRSGSTSSR